MAQAHANSPDPAARGVGASCVERKKQIPVQLLKHHTFHVAARQNKRAGAQILLGIIKFGAEDEAVKVVPLFLICTVALLAAAQSPHDNMSARHPEPPMLGIHWARGQAPRGGGANVDMTYHGGPILSTTTAMAIFWGSGWPMYTGDKITGMDSFYSGINNSVYAASSDEYTGPDESTSNSTSVGPAITYLGHYIDGSAAPSNPKTSAVLNEVCKVLTASSITPTSDSFYMVYVDQLQHGSYCGWHSWGSCNGVNVQFAFVYSLDGIAGCDPKDNITTNSQGLAAIANVTAHEISETRTDPRGNAWYGSSGEENGDKCNWAFDSTSQFGTGIVSFPNNSYWKLQGEWSNNAYNKGSGFPNLNGQDGCIDGDNP